MKIKALILDGIANYLFFAPIVSAVGFFSGWNLDQFIAYWISAIPIGLVGGLVFGRVLNKWRKKFHYE